MTTQRPKFSTALFEHAYVISCNDVKLNCMQRWFEAVKLPFPTVFPAYDSCDRSHYELMKMAKEKNLPYVTVFEDDAYPSKDTHVKLSLLDFAFKHFSLYDKIAILQLGHQPQGANGWKQSPPNSQECHMLFVRNDYSWAGAWATFVMNEAFDERLESLTHSLPTANYDYMKEIGLTYNYADRYNQSFFKKEALICRDNVFEHFDVIKGHKIICSKTFKPPL